MIEFRPFRNTDPPQLAEVWRTHSGQRGLMQPMSVAVLERFVFSKPTFDSRGLFVAAEGDKLLGFAHGGFGPSEDHHALDTGVGVVSLVLVRPEADPAVAGELRACVESYLQARGARTIFGGGRYPFCPFYYGLYGGSEITGMLDSDPRLQAVFQSAGYEVAESRLVLRRELAGFRPPVDRNQMQLRRHTTLDTIIDAPTKTWWGAIVLEPFERTQYFLQTRDGETGSASVQFWNMETMIGAWGVRAVGISGLEVSSTKRRQGLATYLLGESLRQLHAQGYALAEVHVQEDNPSAVRLFRKLGFEEVDRSVLYRKAANEA